MKKIKIKANKRCRVCGGSGWREIYNYAGNVKGHELCDCIKYKIEVVPNY